MPSNPDYYAIGREENLFATFFNLRQWVSLPDNLAILSQDISVTAKWQKGDTIELPKDKKYQNCLLRCNTKKDADLLQLEETLNLPDKQIIL